jgi:hypothetical protein
MKAPPLREVMPTAAESVPRTDPRKRPTTGPCSTKSGGCPPLSYASGRKNPSAKPRIGAQIEIALYMDCFFSPGGLDPLSGVLISLSGSSLQPVSIKRIKPVCRTVREDFGENKGSIPTTGPQNQVLPNGRELNREPLRIIQKRALRIIAASRRDRERLPDENERRMAARARTQSAANMS